MVPSRSHRRTYSKTHLSHRRLQGTLCTSSKSTKLRPSASFTHAIQRYVVACACFLACHGFHALSSLSWFSCLVIIVMVFMPCHHCHGFHALSSLSWFSCLVIIVMVFMPCHHCHGFHALSSLSWFSCLVIIVMVFMPCHHCHGFHALSSLSWFSRLAMAC